MKDVILLPSPKVCNVPKGPFREELYEAGFVISSFELNTLDTEEEIRCKIDNEFQDVIRKSGKAFLCFNFVRAVEKKIVCIKTIGEINGKIL